jgi:hypothetical protein
MGKPYKYKYAQKPTPKAVRLVNRFGQAAVNEAFKGSMDPRFHKEIRDEYDTSVVKLMEYIIELENGL